ncbi:hypothetical protein [Streptomyces sp. NPDC001980]|uniref:hypothetical protein n=1 Tax=Streptomyces sp. NPDC001980 TaxID=3157126 RepID=UPI0033320AB7
MKALAPVGPPEILASLGVSFPLHGHADATGPVEVCAASGVPPERTAATASIADLPADGPA